MALRLEKGIAPDMLTLLRFGAQMVEEFLGGPVLQDADPIDDLPIFGHSKPVSLRNMIRALVSASKVSISAGGRDRSLAKFSKTASTWPGRS
jgi:hypothetical protein